MNPRKLILSSFLILSLISAAPICFAAQYDIKEMTPGVKAALDSRRDRFDQLHQLKEQGAVGENNHGYIEVLNGDAQAQSLADAENKDRKFIYQTIVEQNNLPADAISTVESIFAQVQRDKANTGESIQSEDGQWTKK